jgi:hypothetical protein
MRHGAAGWRAVRLLLTESGQTSYDVLAVRRFWHTKTGAFGFGQIMGPIFAGFASDRLGSSTASAIVAALGLLAAALFAVA